jgi:bile acid:Na+ symporter, BASS family
MSRQSLASIGQIQKRCSSIRSYGFAIGWLLGGPGNDTRRVLALGTAQRNIAAALVVGSQSFSDPKVVVMVIVVAIVGLIILMPLSRALANR